jgi:hypothetical protein
MLLSQWKSRVGAWRSLVAHWHGGPVVAGSNPVAPTNSICPPDCTPDPPGPGLRATEPLLALLVIGLVALAAPGCCPIGGCPIQTPPASRANHDTLFTRWYTDAKSDSGYDLVTVDRAGDSLVLYLQCITGDNPHLRLWGPTTGINRSTQKRLWRFDRLRMQDPGEIFESAADVTTQGANTLIRGFTMVKTVDTPDSMAWQQAWNYIKRTGARDTLAVVRRVVARRGQPYFLVRYEFTWLGGGADSVRFIWSNHPRMGLGGSRNDVGFAPGCGLVLSQRRLDAAALNWAALMLDVGNPLAADADTLADGTSSFMSADLKLNMGSGLPRFTAAFICFDPGADIVPVEFAWMDSTGGGEPSLDYDSPAIAIDTTRVLNGGSRMLLARTAPIAFAAGQTKALEFAVGRASLADDRLPPVMPEVVWSDGSISRWPTGRQEP